MELGYLLKQERLRNNLSQEEVAKAIGSTKQAVYKYENGIVTNIPMEKIEKMAQLFRVTPAYLMGWNESPAIDLQLFGEKRPSNKVELDEDEQRIILTYRTNEMFREAVNNIYRLTTQEGEPKKTVRIYRAARSADHHDAEIVEMDAERLERLKNAPDTDEL